MRDSIFHQSANQEYTSLNPELKPYESDGVSSGTPDDRWIFTNKSSYMNYSSLVAIAGRVVPGILILKPDYPEHMEKWPFL